jgi:hypothetical protein
MAFQVRRVVTGHDAKGRAVVKIDEVSKNIASNRPGATASRGGREGPECRRVISLPKEG